MKGLRILLVILAIIGILISILFFQLGGGFIGVALYVLFGSIVVLMGLIFESKRYKPTHNDHEGWQRTQERFIDHSTGKLMEVFYNPRTGERSYREVDQADK